jgi:hypothetical protein
MGNRGAEIMGYLLLILVWYSGFELSSSVGLYSILIRVANVCWTEEISLKHRSDFYNKPTENYTASYDAT